MGLDRFILLLLLLSISFLSFSQRQNLKFEHLGVKEGLSQSHVNCILQDRRGFMWFGTEEGLNKYDGYKFTVYKFTAQNEKSISHNFISAIIEDRQGYIWIATWGGGLNRFDQAKEQFTRFTYNKNNLNGLSSNYINSLCEDKQGALWIGTESGGLNRFDWQQNQFTHYTNKAHDRRSLSDNDITDIFEDSQSNLWIGTKQGGLNLFDRAADRPKHQTFTRFQHEENNSQSLSDNNAYVIFEDSRRRLWIGTRGGGLELFDRAKRTFQHFRKDPHNPNSLIHDAVFSLAEDREGNLWIGTENGGLSVFNPETLSFNNNRKDDIDNTSLSNNSIYAICADTKGNMWLGTYSGGINFFNRDSNTFKHYQHNSSANSLINNNILCIEEDSKNNLWLGTDGGGLNLFNRETDRFTAFKHEDGNPNSICGDYIVTILADSKGNVWLGTYGDGVTAFNQEKNTYTHFKHNPANPASISSNNVWSIFEDSQQRIWMGTFGGGLDLYDPKKGVFVHYTHDSNNPKSLSNDKIHCFLEDRQGNFWIGTNGGGLNLFNPNAGTFTHFIHEESRNSILSNTVDCIYEDQAGNLWIGTNAGLNHLDRKTKQFTAYVSNDGLPNNVVFGIMEAEKGHLWMSTNKGLTMFNPQTKNFKNYGEADGLQANEFKLNAYCKSRTGAMYFGGINGFNEFFPGRIKQQAFDPPIVITDFQLFNQPVAIASHEKDASPLKKHISETKEITLSYQQSVITLEFASLNYSDAEKKQYAYQLEGFDKGWNKIGSKRTVSYTNLDAGEYLFRVRGLDNQGRWSTKTTSLKLTITPPFWLTWWFKTMAAFFILGAFFTFYHVRVKAIKKHAELKRRTQELASHQLEILAQQERNARKEADKARQEAEDANRAKSVFLATMSHEIRTPMNGMIGMASLLAATPQNAEQQEYTETIRVCGESLLTIVNDILDFTKIESGKIALEKQDLDLRACLEEVLEFFAEKTSSLDLLYQIDDDVPAQIVGDKLRLRQVLMSLIGNAVKFTQHGEIFVGVHLLSTHTGGDLSLGFEVRDTGVGIAADKLDRLFKAFSQVDPSSTRKYGGTGLGLAMSEKLVVLMGGTMAVESHLGIGTTFSFSMQAQVSPNECHYPQYNTADLAGKRILLVDDNATSLETLQSQLLQWKLNVVLAASGKQVLEILAQHSDFDLVMIDQEMSGSGDSRSGDSRTGTSEMNGIQLSQRIRAQYPRLPLMLLNSASAAQLPQHLEVFCAVLVKPVKQYVLCNHLLRELKPHSPTVSGQPSGERKLTPDFALQYPLSILIAEDNLVNQKLAMRILTKLGYQPDLVENGRLALNALDEKLYDLLLMDVQMPEMDGLEATKAIRIRSGKQPLIIALTANAMQGDREMCLLAGMDDYLSKPIHVETLMLTLEKWAIQLTINN